MGRSFKTFVIWFVLLGLFVWMLATFGASNPVTAGELEWVGLGCAAWSVALAAPLAAMSARAARPLSSGAILLVAAAETVLGFALGLPHAALTRGPGPALLLGPSLVGTVLVSLALRTWVIGRRRRALLAALAAHRTRAAADAVIAHEARHRGIAARNEAAVALLDAGFARDAVAMLAAIEGATPGERAVIAGNRAMALLFLGDLDSARAAIADAPVPPTGRLQSWRRIVDARIAAYEGKGAEAIALLATLPDADHSPYRLALEITRAHAHAARGDREAARAVLAALPDHVRVVADGNGPAAAIAAELLADAAQPFR